MKALVCSLCGIVGGSLAYLFGGWNDSIITLLIFMSIDYISGIIVGGVFQKSPKTQNGALESDACWKGLVKKGFSLLIIVVGNRIDFQLGTTFVRDSVTIAFITSELLSIGENAGLMGIPLPKVLHKAIEILNAKEEENGNL